MNPIETLRALWSEPPPVSSLELPAPQNLTELRVRLQSLALPTFDGPPITGFFESALQASALPATGDYLSSEDPLQTLSDRIHERFEEPVEFEPSFEPNLPDLSNTLDEVLGRELMALVASQDLDASHRAEAVQATTLALINPSRDNVRAILRALIKGLRV